MLGSVYKRNNLYHIGENLAQIGQLVQDIWQKQFCLRSGQIAVKRDATTLGAFKIKNNFCIIMVNIWRKSVNWFKRYGKKSIKTVDLGSEQIALKEGRDDTVRFHL